MANTVTIRKLFDGQRHAVLHVYVASDGAAGELADQVIVDASDLAGAPTELTIEEAWWSLNGFSGRLEFDQTADSPALVLFAGQSGKMDARPFGGLQDPGGAGGSGDILLITSGFTAAGDEGVIILKVRKG